METKEITTAKMIEDLKPIALAVTRDDNFGEEDYTQVDDAYSQGLRDGETYAARSVLMVLAPGWDGHDTLRLRNDPKNKR